MQENQIDQKFLEGMLDISVNSILSRLKGYYEEAAAPLENADPRLLVLQAASVLLCQETASSFYDFRQAFPRYQDEKSLTDLQALLGDTLVNLAQPLVAGPGKVYIDFTKETDPDIQSVAVVAANNEGEVLWLTCQV